MSAGVRRWPTLLKLVRRIHLYLGLALLPWVMLYGVTALLFNHADWMSPATRFEVAEEEVPTSLSALLPEPESTAREAFEQLASRAGGASLEWVPGSARWLGSLQLLAEGEELGGRFTLQPEGRGGSLRVFPSERIEDGVWYGLEELEGYAPLSEQETKRLTQVSEELSRARGLPFDSFAVRRTPRVRFDVRSEGKTYACELGLDGEIEISSISELATLRSRLLRLHLQHGDPGYGGAFSLWYMLVDIMGIAMVTWGVSGIVMWWGIRPTRRPGAVAVLVGLCSMAFLAAAVWQAAGY